MENVEACLASGGRAILMVKARSVTQRRPPSTIVRETRERLGRAALRIDGEASLAPFSRDHVALAVHR